MMKKILAVALVFATTFAFGMSVSELNKASKEELMKINGVGEKKADAIIKYRKSEKFKSIDDVEKVKGVGPALAKNIKNDVYKKAPSKKPAKTTTKKETKSKTKSKDSKEKK